MIKKYRLIILVVLLTIISILGVNIYINNENSNYSTNEDVIKVGIYEYEPCYYITKTGNIKGYYHEVLKVISKYNNLNYEYHKYTFEDAIKKLEYGEIDLMVGINKTEERKEKFIYSDISIGVEKYGLYSNINEIRFAHLEAMDGLNLGVIADGTNGEYIKKVFSDSNINVKINEFKEQSELIKSFRSRAMDLSIQPIGKSNYGKLVYEFSTGPVYIAASQNNKELITNIDKIISENVEDIARQLNKSYRKEFDYKDETTNKYKDIFQYIVLSLFSFIIIAFLSYRSKFKSMSIQKKIRKSIDNNEYLLYYQPIYNPKEGDIVGFEALIRKKQKDGKILSPDKFISEIEKNDMLFEISIWILEKVISDYERIHNMYQLNSKKYISINVSIDEVMRDEFINKYKNILNEHDFLKDKICLEIIERVRTENIKDLNQCIGKLKEAGFLIAIDDFGMEYSNLDLLEIIDFDIIKLDKYFIDNVSKEFLKEEILKFLSALSKRANSALIVEGVETKEQNDLVKNIDNEKIYVQGYYYCKPTPVE